MYIVYTVWYINMYRKKLHRQINTKIIIFEKKSYIFSSNCYLYKVKNIKIYK